MTTIPLDVDLIRAQFPALAGDAVFMENAGGSQVPAVVADAIRHYMLNTYVQLDAGYEISDRSTTTVAAAHRFAETFMNADGVGRVILGPSCSQLCAMLAGCYAPLLNPGDEIVVAQSGHEANMGPWTRLVERGCVVRSWPVDRAAMNCRLEDLEPLLNERTKIVALPHVSNLLGEIVDVAAITAAAHAVGARVVVDGVAYAPHRAIDVAAWDVDWYAYSTYKVYGPHMAALYGRHDAIAELEGPNHFFIPRDEVPYKFELGGPSHEGCAGLLALGDYLATISGRTPGAEVDHATITDAFDIMTACELPLQQRLIEYLVGRDDVTIVGPAHAEPSRVATISFVHASRSSREIATAVNARRIGIRHGHMYAYRLCEGLGIDLADGVVRVSMVHYNTLREVDLLIGILDDVL